MQFRIIENEQLTLVTDGRVVIEINPDRFARAGVKNYQSDLVCYGFRIRKRDGNSEN
ncbi:MAG: hypothetical protein ACJAYJ_002814 [Saprospiraceae bacterium]